MHGDARKKSWILAAYLASKESLEVVQSVFLEAGAEGIEIDDGERPDLENKSLQILVKAYFINRAGLEEELKQTLATFMHNCGLSLADIEFSNVIEEDWQGNFVRSCTTLKVLPNIYIVPSFEIEQFKTVSASELFIEMDPENAFGTGHHQTTKLCLTAIYEHAQKEVKALDIGTGSGILAILLAKLGIKQVWASETDADALLTAERNAKKNGVDINFLLVDESFIYPRKNYDLIVANIFSHTLIGMAENIVSALNPGGVIILSGILDYQSAEVEKAYLNLNMNLIKKSLMDDWCVLVFRSS